MPDTVVQVIRVLRPDTYLIRAACPILQSQVSTYMTPFGVSCQPGCEADVIDWVELHADAERLGLATVEYLRDDHGRLLADLTDLRTGETLTSYLLSRGVAAERPEHVREVMESLMVSKEPE
jgi:hypothetical protein